jgi:purine nucleoside permease
VRKLPVLMFLIGAIAGISGMSMMSFAGERQTVRSIGSEPRSESVALSAAAGTSRRPVRVFTIAMFQAEAEPWIANEDLSIRIDVPGSYSPVYCRSTRAGDVLKHCLVVTGMGSANAAATLMAVGTSRHFDLTDTYFLVAGIAGTSPNRATLGAAAWAEWVVDGDLAHEIDAREMPQGWDYPYFHLGCTEPWCEDGAVAGTEVFGLDPDLISAAYELSKDVELVDSEDAATYRANYPEDTPARREPFVTQCDSLSSSTYWHGKLMSDWAEWWTQMWTNGLGDYCMTNMEDSATLTALDRLADSGFVDWDRLMVLRTASNFDQPYPGQTAQESLAANSGAFRPAVQNAYRVGSTVTDHILKNWKQWRAGLPTP